MELIDTHCHFDAEAFDRDRDDLLARSRNNHVSRIISPAITAASWPRLKQVCDQYPTVSPAYGLHPMFMGAHREEHLSQLERLVETEQPIAVGECGLDYYIENADREQQKFYLKEQLAIADRFKTPVIIHARKAVEDVLQMVKQYPGITGAMHSYSGSIQQAEQLIEQGFYLGFGGPITWHGAKRLQRMVEALPLASMLLETDAPDQPGEQHRGERNEPAWILEVAEKIAELKNIPIEEVVKVTSENARGLFKI